MIPVKRFYILVSLLSAASLLTFLSFFLKDPTPLFIPGFSLLVVAIIYRIVQFRCPHCGESVFPRYRRGDVVYCSKCGQKVEYN